MNIKQIRRALSRGRMVCATSWEYYIVQDKERLVMVGRNCRRREPITKEGRLIIGEDAFFTPKVMLTRPTPNQVLVVADARFLKDPMLAGIAERWIHSIPRDHKISAPDLAKYIESIGAGDAFHDDVTYLRRI